MIIGYTQNRAMLRRASACFCASRDAFASSSLCCSFSTPYCARAASSVWETLAFAAARLEFGRVVASKMEAPNMLVNPV